VQRAAKNQSLRERLRESTYNAILEAAESVAAADGLPGASLQAIAQRAGVAVGTIYNYFHDRKELFDELFSRRREELFHAIEAAAKSHARSGFERELSAFVSAVFTHFDARRVFLKIALEAEPKLVKGSDGTRRPAMHQLQVHAERVMRVGLKERQIREGNPRLYATLLVAIVRGVLVNYADDDAPLAAATESVVDVFLHGVAR
jgi:AcrR family transcriptional regulator